MTPLPSFEEFFTAVYKFPPFPWQGRLAREVLEKGWPDLLDLPTGSGKTSALDIALYCLAAAPDRLPRRTVLVVDRRIVVDQGADRARHLLSVMRRASDGPIKGVADALRATFWRSDSASDPFAVAVMRGGMPRDNDWAKRPDQPVLGVSTVDQLGSRLLFRGYGVSSKSASIHAGLLGNDTLILLDEVHLAIPFAQTLSAIRKRYRHRADGLPDRFGVVRMSATAGTTDPGSRIFGLTKDDHAHSVLSQRLTASKPARLVSVKVKGDDEAEKRRLVAKEAVEHALRLQLSARVVAIVVNRVDTARLAHQLLREHAEVTDAELVTGRMRAIDRDQFVRDVLVKRIGPRQTRLDEARPLVLVATQCIEVGADLDFDGLVTECASLDALRQRFGRLDRQGMRRKSEAVILGRSDATAADADDPVYGTALSACWRWLTSLARDEVVDFGISALPQAMTDDGSPRVDVLAPTASAPVLLPAHLDAWAQTSPRPAVDPEVALWLHDPQRSSADVQLVWRSDLSLPDASDAIVAAPSIEDAIQGLSARRPSSLESITVPIFAARQWLLGQPPSAIADVTSSAEGEDAVSRKRTEGSLDQVVALRWDGDESVFVTADRVHRDAPGGSAIRPGDVLVVPCARGGITARSFDPTGKEPVVDVADVAQLRGRGTVSLLLHPDALRVWTLPPDIESAPEPDDDETLNETRARVAAWVAHWPDVRAPTSTATEAEWTALTTSLASGRRMQANVLGKSLLVTAPVQRTTLAPPEVGEALTEDDDSSFRQKEIALSTHSRDVRDFAAGYATAVGFTAELAADLGLSAWLHDVGKADERFQRWLVGGSEVRFSMLTEPLAKSALPAGSRAARQLARRRAGYPPGYRHELLSLAMIENDGAALEHAHDRDLVLHLVASHHGWCRPFAPMADHPDDFAVELKHGDARLAGRTRHEKSRLDSGVGARFWSLVDKYGWWGLAWLEAVMRLADHRASEMETEGLE